MEDTVVNKKSHTIGIANIAHTIAAVTLLKPSELIPIVNHRVIPT
jgi:hypothetical protein